MEQEKDNFWVYIAGVIVAAVVVIVMVKNSEHGKYETARKAIAEEPAQSAYRDVSKYNNSITAPAQK